MYNFTSTGASLVAGVKNPPCNARDTGSIPGPGRHYTPSGNWACVPKLLSSHCRLEPQVLTTEPMLQLLGPTCPTACAPGQRKPLQGEALTAQAESSSHSPQLGNARLQQPSPSTAKNKYWLKVFHRYSTRDMWTTTHFKLHN